MGKHENQLSMTDQVRIRREKLAALQQEGRDPFQQTKYTVTSDAAAIKADFAGMEGRDVSLAGRIMSKRGMGKVLFCDLQDHTGRIQLYVKFDEMPEAQFQDFKKYDIGDIVGVKGEVFRTKQGEISVRATEATLLSKIAAAAAGKIPRPDATPTLRYRQRYVDLIVNPEVRGHVCQALPDHPRSLRSFLDARGLSGGGDARPATPSPAARRRGRSSPTTTRWTWTCTCASRRSCT